MEATIDATGRILIPKALRTALGMTPGDVVDISAYDDGLRIMPSGRTARLVRNQHQPGGVGSPGVGDAVSDL